MNKEAIIARILSNCSHKPKHREGAAFAPANIALCKYWGKRNTELNLPVTSSLSVSLGNLGAKTTIEIEDSYTDRIFVNQEEIKADSNFAKNLSNFLNLFRTKTKVSFRIKTTVNIPIGAGLASSACGFAATVNALNQLYEWQLPNHSLSILARIGSGSAARSLWQGFVEWQAGIQEDGMDSFAIPLPQIWPNLRIGLLIVNAEQKAVSSREAMQRTVLTSPFYSAWPEKQALDLNRLKQAIYQQSFVELGEISESNALAMHALMLTANPSILYSEAATVAAIHKIWHYRRLGLLLFFTQDAGPNLKLLFQEQDIDNVVKIFPNLQVVAPFKNSSQNDTSFLSNLL